MSTVFMNSERRKELSLFHFVFILKLNVRLNFNVLAAIVIEAQSFN